MKKTWIVIGLKAGEIVGGFLLFVVLPYIIGSYIAPLISRRPEPIGWVWFFGFVAIVLVVYALWLIYSVVMYAIPAWIRANQRWASSLVGEEKIYCHACTEKADDKKPVHHYQPVCKQKKKKENK